MIARVVMVSALLAGGCHQGNRSQGTTAPDAGDGAACSQLAMMADKALTEAVTSTDQCATKDDCGKLLNVSFACLDCVHIAGGERLQAAVAAKAGEINQICGAFKSSGCQLIPSGCPAFFADPRVECQHGQCVVPAMGDAGADGTPGKDAAATALPACHWPATLDATDAAPARCTAKRHRLSCEGRDGGVFVECVSDNADQCQPPPPVVGVTFSCHDVCKPGEYGAVCGGIGPGGASSDPPSPGCRAGAPTPGGTAFYCCPCEP